MASSSAPTVDAYLASLPADRRDAIATVRTTILRKLPRGYEERMMAGMIGYVVPLTRLPKTYNGQPLMLAALASQKQHMSLYLLSVYGHAGLRAWFEQAWRAAGKKLDMGKSCVRFKRLDELALDVVGEAIARVGVDAYVEQYHAARAGTAEGRRAAAKTATKAAKTTTKAAKTASKVAKTATKVAKTASKVAKTAAKVAKTASTSAKKAVTKPASKSTSSTKPAAKSGARAARSGRTSASSTRSRSR